MNTKSTFATMVVLAGVCLGSIAGSASAQAASTGEVSIKVQSSDLDLSRPDGAKVMLQRIHNAASQICGPTPTDWLAYGRQYKACIKQIVDRAVDRLDSPTVTAMNSGAPAPVRVAEASDRP